MKTPRPFAARNLLVLLLMGAALALGFFIQSGQAPKEAARLVDDDNSAFEIIDAAHREFDGSPALALSFSLPLDARRQAGDFIQVLEMPARAEDLRQMQEADSDGYDGNDSTLSSEVSTASADTQLEGGKPVSGAWVVGDNPRLIFFPGIKPQTRYLIRVQNGLAARNGKTLATEQRYAVRTAAIAPSFYFSSRGIVLPAGQNGGLPVTTVNVPEVDIQFLKVKADALPAFLDKVTQRAASAHSASDTGDTGDTGDEENEGYYERTDLKGAIDSWTLDRLHKMTESVFAGRFNTEQKANRRSVTFIPVEGIPELREPGVYIAVMSQPKRFRSEQQTTYFYVSDLGLHLRKHAAGSADAFVSSLVDGKAVRDVEVSWLSADGKLLAQAKTDGDGRAAFAEQPQSARVVMARKGEQLSLIALKEPALDLSEFATSGLISAPIRLFAYSGRNLYRPGETFSVSVLARDADGQPLPAQPIQALLRRPDGKAQWTANWTVNSKFSGYYQQQIELPADAATGTWWLELRGDPAAKQASTRLSFNVEEFLPERMKLDLGAATGTLAAGSGWPLQIKGNYLYGAPAAGNRLLGVVNTAPNPQALPSKLPGFIFGDADEANVRQRQELEESALDEQGKAQLEVDLSTLENRRSPFTVRATLSLLESGGRPVIRSVERTWWPAPALVGLRPLFNGEYARENSIAEFETVLADAEGKLYGASALPVRIFRENRDWYWRFDDQRGWHSGFSETDELVASSKLDIPAGGRGKLALPVKYGRYRVEVLNPANGLVTRYRFYAGWFAKDDESQGVRPDRVALKFDKASYREGETARLTLTPPHAGEALITVEGDRLLWSKRISLPREGGSIELPIAPEWKRHDLYVTALVLRPGNGGSKVTPARALGIAYLPLTRDERKLTVSLDAPQKMEPDRPLKVKIKVPQATDGQAMVTLSAVDAGILNITNFKSPDPFAFFFAKLRYGQDLYDIYGRLIEKMAGQKGKLKWGGDAAPKATRSLPKKVRLVDLFSGPVALDAKGEAEISLPVPDFNGSLRLMAVASSAGRFGMQETDVTVAAPLVVELATPRFLSIGDAALLALDVHNLAGSEQEVNIHVSNADGLLIRDATQKIKLRDQQKRTVRIPFEAGSAHGLTEVQVRIDSPRSKLTRSFPLQVQAPTPRQNLTRRHIVEAGESLTLQESELGGFLPQTVSANLAVSDQPPIDVRSAVRGLLTYPYGCTEQTTST
ncbi:alpha-2-macroglobulin family protein, partial [Azonexus sp.]|uniref:alpha-2-macroglobulin family protein n=1 Tax=Azonexus sp. TaxID=1872668 RepID=UPI0039E5250C